jgi:hypothetical protein
MNLLEERNKKADATVEEALDRLNAHLTPMTFTLQDLIDVKAALAEAREHLQGKNDGALEPSFPTKEIESDNNPRCPSCGAYDDSWDDSRELWFEGSEAEGVCDCGEPYRTEITSVNFSFVTQPREAGDE